MASNKELNGLPNILEQRFFSSLFFTKEKGMTDWIWNGAVELNIQEIEIDILRKIIIPKDLEIKSITTHLPRLWLTIEETLSRHGFSEDYIETAKFDIFVSSKYQSQKLLTCKTTIIDKNGKIYYGKSYTERAVQEFSVFKKPLSDKSFLSRLVDRIKK
jgi:hypothetical protein